MDTEMTNETTDPIVVARGELVHLVGQLVPRPVSFATAEGQMLTACIEGLLSGENQMGVQNPGHEEAMANSDIMHPGALDMMRRECLKLVAADE
jgi:hypothetical protein